MSQAAEALQAVSAGNTDGAFWSALAELQLVRGELPSARGAAEQAIRYGEARGSRVLGIVEMLAASSPDGARIYFDGLSRATSPDAIQPYFDDIRLILNEDELREWKALKTGRPDWIARKWEWRSLLAGVSSSQRLVENQRRLAHVMTSFLRISYRGAPPSTSVWMYDSLSWVQPIDDRGMIYLRHGAPAREVPRFAGTSRIAWYYAGVGPMLALFEFGQSDRADYFLAEPYPVCKDADGSYVDVRTRTKPVGALPSIGDPMDWAMALYGFDRALGNYYARCKRGSDWVTSDYFQLRAEARRNAEDAWNIESASPRFADPLAATINLYAFRHRDGSELVAFLAVPSGRLNARSVDGRYAFELNVSIGAGDPVTERVFRADTSISLIRSEPLPADAVLRTAVSLVTPISGRAPVTLTLGNRNDSNQGQVLSASRRLPRFLSDSLALSDIVIGETRDGVWRRGSHALAPIAGHAVPAGRPFRLYYEVYAARDDDPLHVEVQIVPGRDESVSARIRSLIASRQALSVQFDETARADPDGAVRVQRDIDAGLQSGSYAVVITVRNMRTGQIATAETNLIILDRCNQAD
jgi:hypothetical protein